MRFHFTKQRQMVLQTVAMDGVTCSSCSPFLATFDIVVLKCLVVRCSGDAVSLWFCFALL